MRLTQRRESEDRHADEECEHFDPGMFANDGHDVSPVTFGTRKDNSGALGLWLGGAPECRELVNRPSFGQCVGY
jgi:hypothetical protein